MGEFADVVRRRRMTRDFRPDSIPPEVLSHLVDLAARAPSAGKTQGWSLVVLNGEETAEFWDLSLPAERRAGFRWQGLLQAPVIAIALADPQAYVARYSEADKARTGLGQSRDVWPTPYWTVDGSMAIMTLLLAAEDVGLGALFFGVFNAEAEIRSALGIPESLEILGALALGYPATGGGSEEPGASGLPTVAARGRSASRPRRSPEEIIHYRRFRR
jgi:nitroreductase